MRAIRRGMRNIAVVVPAVLAFIASPAVATHGGAPHKRIASIEEASGSQSEPVVVRGTIGELDKSDMPAQHRGAQNLERFTITAGDRLWLVDNGSGEVTACSLVRGIYVGQRAIMCWSR